MWINTQFLMERLDNDSSIVQELLFIFLNEYSRLLNELKTAVDTHQPTSKVGHSIKGMCRDVGANQLAEWASLIEHEKANPQQMLDKLTLALHDLKKEVDAFLSTTV
jgi:HPt (histidine-containing phosphotransfer) domain-containing protein